jgi:AAA ATPase domain
MQEAVGRVIGRDAALGEVSAFLLAAAHEFSQLTILGEPGIGKTTVWQETLRLARARGAGVRLTRPSESEATLSLAALTDLFETVSEAWIDRLPVPQREAISAALLRTPAARGGIDERALCASVLSLLRLFAADGPVIIAVDDAQWLDSASGRVLRFAARRLHGEAVGFVLTARTGTTPPSNIDLAADPNRRRTIQLGPLTLAALHELIKQRTQRSLPRHVLVQILRASGGNALYALEIAAELAVRDSEGDMLPVPSSLTDLVAARTPTSPAGRRAPGPRPSRDERRAVVRRRGTPSHRGGADPTHPRRVRNLASATRTCRAGALIDGSGRVEFSERLRKQQLAEQSSECSSLIRGERRQQPLLVRQMRDQRRIDGLVAIPGKRDERATPVARIGMTFNQPQGFDSINPVGHRPGREHDGIDQASRAHLIGGT